MNFSDVLDPMLRSCPDALGVALMGTDGISIARSERQPGELSAIAIEFGRTLPELQKAADATGGGLLEEMALRFAGYWVLVRPIDADTLLVMTLDSDANFGRARFEMRRQLLALRSML